MEQHENRKGNLRGVEGQKHNRGSGMNDLFSKAIDARDAGIEKAFEAQDRKDPAWVERAYNAIVEIAKRSETVHVDDVLSTFSNPPRHPNSWGAVWMRAIRNGVIARTGTARPCTIDPKKHAHNYPVYRSLVLERQAA
jgi:hypothetical protein